MEIQFNINKNLWKIKLVDKHQLLTIYKTIMQDEEEPIFCYGVTVYSRQVIFINEDMEIQQQIKTLKHELTHYYIWNNALFNVPNYTEEMVCDLVACSNEFVNEIVEIYEMKLKENKE